MKTNHQQPAVGLSNPLCTTLLALTVLVLLANTIAYADYIYVSCNGSGKIEKLDSSGTWLGTFASGLYNPMDLEFDSQGNLWVVERGNNRITKLNPQGQMVDFIPLGSATAVGLAFDGAGSLYVSDSYYDTIRKFANGQQVSSFTVPAIPEDIEWRGDYLYVAEWDPGVIGEYNGNGIGGTLPLQGSVGSPRGIAFDNAGNLYASDAYNDKIKKITMAGVVSDFYTLPDITPEGLEFDSTGCLYLASYWEGKIWKFGADGIFLNTFWANPEYTGGTNGPVYIATQVPEPGTLILLGLGGLMMFRRRRQKELKV